MNSVAIAALYCKVKMFPTLLKADLDNKYYDSMLNCPEVSFQSNISNSTITEMWLYKLSLLYHI